MNADHVASTAQVATERPGRYAKQLTAHLGRRSGGEWSDDAARGWINLGSNRVELSAEAAVLTMTVTAPGPELDRLEDVVGRHLVRFGTRDELVVDWVREDGSAGTSQRHGAE